MKDSKPTIYDPAFLPTNIYSGVPSFLNLPVIETQEDLESVDVAVMGVPWEGGCTIGGYSSCTEGPKSIRSASIRYTGYLPEFDIDSFAHLKAGDCGDIPVQNGSYDFTSAGTSLCRDPQAVRKDRGRGRHPHHPGRRPLHRLPHHQ